MSVLSPAGKKRREKKLQTDVTLKTREGARNKDSLFRNIERKLSGESSS